MSSNPFKLLKDWIYSRMSVEGNKEDTISAEQADEAYNVAMVKVSKTSINAHKVSNELTKLSQSGDAAISIFLQGIEEVSVKDNSVGRDD